jgi:hypothetical protein
MILVNIVVKIKIWNEDIVWMLNEKIRNYELVIMMRLKLKWYIQINVMI